MSNYTIEISGNQPYYVEVSNSTLQDIVNLTVTRDNDINVGVSTSNTFISFEFPSGYPISDTSGILPANRVGSGYPITYVSGLFNYYTSRIIYEQGKDPQVIIFNTIANLAIDGGTP